MAFSELIIIAAIEKSNGIGINNVIPWHLPEDLKFFKKNTLGHCIVMGRKTFESIGKPLPERRNIVLTQNSDYSHPGIEVINSFEKIFELCKKEKIFIIGGSKVYQKAMPFANKLIITEIDKDFECDTFFPKIELKNWLELSRNKNYSKKNNFSFFFVTYSKKN